LLASLFSGLAVAYIGREVRPAFYDGRSLSEITGLPILGTVSLILNPAQLAAHRKSMWRFVGGTGALIGTYLAGFLVLALLSARAA
jgi:hypothetical protein